ncbi:MAG: molybdopterin molybdotransferase MoeA [Eubacteriaceae bacterium]|nr:molybdopterin molybdotransferase MoeA [Eubacteriaceae bacterium]
MELLKVKTVDEMKKIIRDTFVHLKLETEKISINESLGRVLENEMVSTMNVPHFNRSVVDGFAVKLTDVQGASTAIPGFLRIAGEVLMGKETHLVLNQGETIYVPTGGMLPQGTEAMVMIEYCEKLGDQDLAIYKNAGSNENIMLIGDDIKIGDCVFQKGHLLRPQDIGVLSALGYLEVDVFKLPRVTIISTGDEIIRPGEVPKPGEVIDINTPALGAVTQRLGARVVFMGYARDDCDTIQLAVKNAIEKSDMVVLSGGSSMGEKDYTSKVIDNLGEVLIHGLSVKPGKPTILGIVDGKPVVGLPGQPASAIMVYMIILREFMTIFYGQDHFKYQTIQGKLMENIHAAPGRRTFQTVAIKEVNGLIEVRPTYGKSGMITLLSYSDGYIEMTENEEGKNAGDSVQVTLF